MSNSQRFEEIIDEMKTLLNEAIDLVPDHMLPRAKSYWYAHILTNLSNDHDYMSKSMCSMQDTLIDLDDSDLDEDDE